MHSVADHVMRNLDIPVLMLRASGSAGSTSAPTLFRRVLIPLDGTRRAEAIIDDAIAVAGPEATYVLTRIVAPLPAATPGFVAPFPMSAVPTDLEATEELLDDARKYLRDVAATMASKGATHVEQVACVSEDPAEAIIAQRSDLIAIASRGLGASRFLLGSMTDKLLKNCVTPLLVKRVRV
jgi:nucleotide-binding universal stress UspA family protein